MTKVNLIDVNASVRENRGLKPETTKGVVNKFLQEKKLSARELADKLDITADIIKKISKGRTVSIDSKTQLLLIMLYSATK